MWPNSQETADLVTFAEGNLNGKIHLCAVCQRFKMEQFVKIVND